MLRVNNKINKNKDGELRQNLRQIQPSGLKTAKINK